MADGGDGGGGGGGDLTGSEGFDGSTGYGSGNIYGGNSETGPLSSPNVQASSDSWDQTTPEQAAAQKGGVVTTHTSPTASSLMMAPGTANFGTANYSNTGAPGSQPLPETWTSKNELNRQANVIEQAPSKMMPQTAAFQSAVPSSMNPADSVGRGTAQAGGMHPTDVGKEQQKPPEDKPNAHLPGQNGAPPLKGKMPRDTWYDQYKVQRSPYPFQPQIPVAGSGVKRSFFTAQEDLLKAMMPGWK